MVVIISTLSFFNCRSKLVDFSKIDTKSNDGYIHAVIEIPAGTNSKIEFNKTTKIFAPDVKDGKERIIDFLSYPANYGFIPSTYSDPADGGDGDPVDILVLGSTLESGTLIEVIPIGVLKLLDNGEEDFKVLAVPAKLETWKISLDNFIDFNNKYPGAKDIIEIWFKNYNREDTSEILGWGDELEAMTYIENNARTKA